MLSILQVTSQSVGEATGGEGLSIVSLLLAADPIVKAVLVILLLASVWSWAIILEKTFTLGGARRKARQFEERFWSGQVDDVDARPGAGIDPAGRVFAAIARDWNDLRKGQLPPGGHAAMIGRAERSLKAQIDREVGRQTSGLGVLATVGSSSPFIGLFGTVWGIMNAFLNISEKQDTSLATVAGPIAEALFATGLGLVAAIPAVIFYNKFSTDLNRLADQLDTFAQDVLVRLSRRASETGVER